MQNLPRIAFDPQVMGGKPCIGNAGDGRDDCGIGRFRQNG